MSYDIRHRLRESRLLAFSGREFTQHMPHHLAHLQFQSTDLLVRAIVQDVLPAREVLDRYEPVPHVYPTVDRGGAPVHDLGDVDAVVSGDVLVADAARDGEAEALVALRQLHLQEILGPVEILISRVCWIWGHICQQFANNLVSFPVKFDEFRSTSDLKADKLD